MATFDNLNHILILVHFYETVVGKWPQLAVNGPKWSKLAQIFPKTPKIANNCQIVLQHDPKWQCLAFVGHIG